jgi:hypothetical protein
MPEVLHEPPEISFTQAGLLRIGKDNNHEESSVEKAQQKFEKERVSLRNAGLLIKSGAALLVAGAAFVAVNGFSEKRPEELIIGGGLFVAGLGVLSRYNHIDIQKGFREAGLEDIENLTQGSFTPTPQK